MFSFFERIVRHHDRLERRGLIGRRDSISSICLCRGSATMLAFDGTEKLSKMCHISGILHSPLREMLIARNRASTRWHSIKSVELDSFPVNSCALGLEIILSRCPSSITYMISSDRQIYIQSEERVH